MSERDSRSDEERPSEIPLEIAVDHVRRLIREGRVFMPVTLHAQRLKIRLEDAVPILCSALEAEADAWLVLASLDRDELPRSPAWIVPVVPYVAIDNFLIKDLPCGLRFLWYQKRCIIDADDDTCEIGFDEPHTIHGEYAYLLCRTRTEAVAKTPKP